MIEETAQERRRYMRAFVIGALLLGVAVYWAFAKSVPFTGHHEIKAVFSSATQLNPGNPVRISGLPVGKVTKVEGREDGTALVTMQLDEEEHSLHKDARISIEPRLLFEGNFAVQIRPGSPSAPKLEDGDTVPLRQTDTPVQIDQFLSTFDTPTRADLQRTFRALSTGLGEEPSGASALRRASTVLAGSLDDLGTTARAIRGTQSGDLPRAIAGTGDVTEQLVESPAALADIVTNYRRVFAALSDRDAELAATLRELLTTWQAAPAQLRRIDRALPAVTRFADALRPALRVAPSSLSDIGAFLDELRAAVQPSELPRTLDALSPVTQNLPTLERRTRTFLPLAQPITDCVSSAVVPTLLDKLDDGPHSSGRPVWQDFVHLGANLSSAASSFDGNGTTLRLGVNVGELGTSGTIPNIGEVTGTTNITGFNPVVLPAGQDPAWRPDQPCREQKPADLQARSNFKEITGIPGFKPQRFSPAAIRNGEKWMELLRSGDREKLLDALLALTPLKKAAPKKASAEAGAVPAPAVSAPAQSPAPATAPAAPAKPKTLLPGVTDGDVPKTVNKLLGDVGGFLGKLTGGGGS